MPAGMVGVARGYLKVSLSGGKPPPILAGRRRFLAGSAPPDATLPR